MARSRPLSGALALAAALAAVIVPGASTASAAPPGAKDVTAVLFEWNYASVAKECTNALGPAGYGYVQVSPPAEHIQGSQWWTSYQPVSYRIAGRLGDAHGVPEHGEHLPRGGREGRRRHGDQPHGGGQRHRHRRLVVHEVRLPGPVLLATTSTTAPPRISNYADRWNVQHCELVGLADLDTGEEYVRRTIAGYLNDLLALGVDGFRIDAAKHIDAADLAEHQVPADEPRRVLEAGGHLRRRRGRPARPSTPATATSRSSATPTTSSASSPTRTSPT